MATPTWSTIEVPILEAIATLSEGKRFVHNSTQIAEATGLSVAEVGIALGRLKEASYIAASPPATQYNTSIYAGIRLLERGLREVNVWPREEVGVTIVNVLDEQIEAATDPVERSRLERLRDAAVGVGSQTLTALVIEGAKRAAFGA